MEIRSQQSRKQTDQQKGVAWIVKVIIHGAYFMGVNLFFHEILGIPNRHAVTRENGTLPYPHISTIWPTGLKA